MKNFQSLAVEDYLQIFWRRKWYFVVIFILVGTGATVYAMRQQQYFRSETRIMVESAVVPEDYVRPVVRSSPQDRINAIRAQLESRTFLARIIEQFQLFGFGSGPGFRSEDAVNGLRGNIKIDVSTGNVFTLSYYSTDPQSARDVTKKLADSLIQANTAAQKNATIETDQFVDEQLRRAERDLGAQETKIMEYKTSHLGTLPEQGGINLTILMGLQPQLASVEGLIERFKEQQKLLDVGRQEQERLNVLMGELLPDPIESRPTQAGTVTGASTPITTATPLEQQLAVRRAQLAQLGSRLRPGHPDYDALDRDVKDLEQKIADMNAARKNLSETTAAPLTPLGAQPSAGAAGAVTRPKTDAGVLPFDLGSAEYRIQLESLKDEIAKRERERGELAKQIKLAQGKLNLAPVIEQELMALTRDREVLQQRYNDLQSKKFNSQMAASLATDINNESYKIIDEANLPDRPSFPDRAQIILMGLGAGFFLGLAVVAGREYLDPTLGSEHEAAKVLNLPVLICIPEISEHSRAGKRLLAKKAS